MFVLILLACEALAAIAVLIRLGSTFGGSPLGSRAQSARATIAVIVPVLNEEARLAPCLDALAASAGAIAEIVVVDGGSSDGTRGVVLAAAAREPRIRLVEAGPPPPGWNGKAWNLETGLRAVDAEWIATVDADVRVGPNLIADAAARAAADGLAALSVATRQRLPDAISALLHPALLTTLVYRAGMPNVAVAAPADVQANGQVFIAHRTTVIDADAFGRARASRCEDVTAARAIAAAGGRVGFYEGDATVQMYDSWRDCARNWPRSLTLRDGFVAPARLWLALLELLLAQALPLPTLLLVLALGDRIPDASIARGVAVALVFVRLGVLAGTRRAYPHVSWAYWLSPLCDLPAVALLVRSALTRRAVWRGRVLVSDRV
jgi:dolichol-phosphate mannosyltransferase